MLVGGTLASHSDSMSATDISSIFYGATGQKNDDENYKAIFGPASRRRHRKLKKCECQAYSRVEPRSVDISSFYRTWNDKWTRNILQIYDKWTPQGRPKSFIVLLCVYLSSFYHKSGRFYDKKTINLRHRESGVATSTPSSQSAVTSSLGRVAAAGSR